MSAANLSAWLAFTGAVIVAFVTGVMNKRPQDRAIALEEMKAALAWQHDEIVDLRQKVAECHSREARTQVRLSELEAVVRRVGTQRIEEPDA
jgi:uncharacterized coiled-coil protein SlyX